MFARQEGFEPPMRQDSQADLESATFDHSDTDAYLKYIAVHMGVEPTP